MRKKLKRIQYGEYRHAFSGIFVRMGKKVDGETGKVLFTMLLKNVKCKNKLVADHIWIDCDSPEKYSEFYMGMELHFNAKIYKYRRGYGGTSWNNKMYKRPGSDYGLCDIAAIRPVSGYNNINCIIEQDSITQ